MCILMGAKEDLVQQRLSMEAAEAQKRAAAQAEREAQQTEENQKEADRLLIAIETEADRIAVILEEADWSKAELKKFIRREKSRWTRRTRRIRFNMACLMFLWPPAGSNNRDAYYYMRSDGSLWIESSSGLRSPRKYFLEYYQVRGSHQDRLRKLEQCLEELQTIKSLENCTIR